MSIHTKIDKYKRLLNLCKQLSELQHLREGTCHSESKLSITLTNDNITFITTLCPKVFMDISHTINKLLEANIKHEEL